jgi:predicted dehydrogenase
VSLRLGAAVVGAGYWGPNLVRNLSASPAWDVRWICDLDVERARLIAGPEIGVSSDIDQALADPRVDAVVVATPASTHDAVTMRAIEAGKHVLIEKPLADTFAAGKAIVDAANRRGVVLMCDHTFCYTPAVEYLRSLVSNRTLGEIQYFDSVRINLGLVRHDTNVLWDLAPHDLSILDFVLPEGLRPVSVAAHGADPLGTGQACIAYLYLQLSGGAIAHVHVNWLSPVKVRTTMVGGSKRTAIWDDTNPAYRLLVFDRGVDMIPMENLDLEAQITSRISYRAGDMHAPALSGREALAAVVAEFASAIRQERTPRTDGASGLRVLEILEAADQSMALEGAVIQLETLRT